MKKIENYILLIVSIVALVGIGILLLSNSYTDFIGQTTSAIKFSKKVSCTETDRGQDYGLGGIAISDSIRYIDYCLQTSTEGYPVGSLYEYYCSENLLMHEIISCQEEFGADYRCSSTSTGGACTTVTTTTPTTTDTDEPSTTVTGRRSTGSVNLG